MIDEGRDETAVLPYETREPARIPSFARAADFDRIAGRGSVQFDALPRGLETPVLGGRKLFRKSLILRILVARAIVTQLSLLIFDGTLHNMEPSLRQILLRWLCSKDESWSIIFVSNDPTIREFVDRRVLLG